MAIAYCRSLDQAEVATVEFVTLQGEVRSLQLLVDSGFTGKSSLILGKDAVELVRAEVPPAQARGALAFSASAGELN